MSGGGGEEKTEKPTPQKLKEAREQGQIPRTQDLSGWLALLVLSFLMGPIIKKLYLETSHVMQRLPEVVANPQPETAIAALLAGAKLLALMLLPLLGSVVVISIVSNAVQGGTQPSSKRLKPKWQMLNIFSGMKRLFGPHSWWELAKALIKTTLIALVAWRDAKELVPALANSGLATINASAELVGNGVAGLLRDVALAGLVIAGADYMINRRMTMKKLKMTLKEVQEEHKRSEGDPHMKGRIRSRAMAISRNRMMAAVPSADVIVLNPTHIAVALRYDANHGTPQVVAIGVDHLAARIREIASANRIPMVQDKPLARALHGACKVGDDIPEDLFTAVAKVLAFVMTLKRAGTAAGVHSSSMVEAVLARR